MAEDLNFHLFFSFDYEDTQHGSWANVDVIELIQKYSSSRAYFKHDLSPLVGTYKGPDQASDLTAIEQQTNCILVSACASSTSAKKIGESSNADVDFFDWAVWPVDQGRAGRDGCPKNQNLLNGTPATLTDSPANASRGGSNPPTETVEASQASQKTAAADPIPPLSSLDRRAIDMTTAEGEKTAHSSQNTRVPPLPPSPSEDMTATIIPRDIWSSQTTEPFEDETTTDETTKVQPATTKVSMCSPPPASKDRIISGSLSRRAPNDNEPNVCAGQAVIMPKDMRNSKKIEAYLNKLPYVQSVMKAYAPSMGITAYFWVNILAFDDFKELQRWTGYDGVSSIIITSVEFD